VSLVNHTTNPKTTGSVIRIVFKNTHTYFFKSKKPINTFYYIDLWIIIEPKKLFLTNQANQYMEIIMLNFDMKNQD